MPGKYWHLDLNSSIRTWSAAIHGYQAFEQKCFFVLLYRNGFGDLYINTNKYSHMILFNCLWQLCKSSLFGLYNPNNMGATWFRLTLSFSMTYLVQYTNTYMLKKNNTWNTLIQVSLFNIHSDIVNLNAHVWYCNMKFRKRLCCALCLVFDRNMNDAHTCTYKYDWMCVLRHIWRKLKCTVNIRIIFIKNLLRQ